MVTHSLSVSEPPSVRLTAEHAEIRERLRHLGASLANLDDALIKDRRRTMDQIIAFIEEHIEQHTRREDRALYPMVERHLHSTAMTAALRVEHRFMLQDVEALRRLSAEPTPDARAFTRLVDNLLGLFVAHCAAEEEVLFPICDEMAAAGSAVDH